MKKKQKNFLIVSLIVGILSITIVGFTLTQVIPLAFILHDDGGGSLPPPPPPPVQVFPPPAPILASIIPNPDTDGDISLQWSIVSSISSVGYQLYFRPRGGSWVLIKTTVLIAYTHRGLTSGTFEYAVKAYSEYGISILSNIKSVIVDISIISPLEPPPPPIIIIPEIPALFLTVIIPSVSSDGIIQLSWTKESSALSYEVWRSDDGAPYVRIADLIITGTYTDTIITNGNYNYKIIGVNPTKRSPDSNIITVTVTIPTIQSPPPPPLPPPTEQSTPITDYTILYILLGGLGGLIATIIYLKYRKRSKLKSK
ncbi:MAG: hypothetical protein KJI71_01715 [Patescibacteria group bacterium]|nr:hypothetical protein [Patescibacteria group bacterium]